MSLKLTSARRVQDLGFIGILIGFYEGFRKGLRIWRVRS